MFQGGEIDWGAVDIQVVDESGQISEQSQSDGETCLSLRLLQLLLTKKLGQCLINQIDFIFSILFCSADLEFSWTMLYFIDVNLEGYESGRFNCFLNFF